MPISLSLILYTSDLICLVWLFTGVMFYNCHSRTLSNWVYELDKWAPSVVKISYKVKTFFIIMTFCIFLHKQPKHELTHDQSDWLILTKEIVPFLSLHCRELLRCVGVLCLNSAAGSSMSCWQPMNTSSRTSRYWPRWHRLQLSPFWTVLWCFPIVRKKNECIVSSLKPTMVTVSLEISNMSSSHEDHKPFLKMQLLV